MLGVDVGPTDAALAADTTTAMQASHAMCLAIMLQTRCGKQSLSKGTMGIQDGATERKHISKCSMSGGKIPVPFFGFLALE